MANYTSLGNFFEAVANAIRTKKGTTDKIKPINFPEEIESIETGGGSGSSGGSGIDSWIAGETTEVIYTGETIASGTFSYPSTSTYLNKITKFYGANVKTIGSGAFYKRTELTEVDFPNVETLQASFMYCSALTSVSFPKLITLGASCFYSATNLVTVDIPSVTSLGDQTFYNCKNLVMSELPKNLVSIDANCFQNCTSITISEIPEGVTRIGGGAFYGCTGLTSITLPSTLTTLEGKAFADCTGLTEVTFKSKPKATTSTNLFSNTFNYCTNIQVINVPWSEGEDSNAPWGATNATINYNYTG